MTVDELLTQIRAGGDHAHEAAMTLGLLIERDERGPDADDSDISAALPPEYADRRLSAPERDAAVNGLLAYVSEEPRPLAPAVWALGKSDDGRVPAALISVLERTLDDPAHEHLAYQALTGVIPFGGAEVDRAIRAAAERGHGEVGDSARQYLRVSDAGGPGSADPRAR